MTQHPAAPAPPRSLGSRPAPA